MSRRHPYFAIKAATEAQILAAIARGVPGVVVRPSVCLGPWDVKPRARCWMPALADGRILVTPEHRLNVVDTRDVANGLVTALEGALPPAPVRLVGRNTTIGELFGLVCESVGAVRPVWTLPAELGVVPALWSELAFAAAGRASPLPSLVPMLICEQDWIELDATQARLGVSPRPLEETVTDALAWYRELGYV